MSVYIYIYVKIYIDNIYIYIHVYMNVCIYVYMLGTVWMFHLSWISTAKFMAIWMFIIGAIHLVTWCHQKYHKVVGGWAYPSEKYESQIGSSSQLLGKIKAMFQTTNQIKWLKHVKTTIKWYLKVVKVGCFIEIPNPHSHPNPLWDGPTGPHQQKSCKVLPRSIAELVNITPITFGLIRKLPSGKLT